MTTDELTAQGEAFLRRTIGCRVVLVNPILPWVGSTVERPDLLGYTDDGSSYVIEVKGEADDPKREDDKTHNQPGAWRLGMCRYMLADKRHRVVLPLGTGQLMASDSGVAYQVGEDPWKNRTTRNRELEIAYLVHALAEKLERKPSGRKQREPEWVDMVRGALVISGPMDAKGLMRISPYLGKHFRSASALAKELIDHIKQGLVADMIVVDESPPARFGIKEQ